MLKVCTISYNNLKHRLMHFCCLSLGTNACPQCQVPLRRNNFRVQLFDPMVEKELEIRKKILKDYNKKVSDKLPIVFYLC